MAMRFSDLMGVGLIFVVTAIALGIGADVVDTVQADQTSDTYAYNASEDGLEGIGELSSWMPTLAIVTAAAIIIGTLVTSFVMGRR